MSTKKERKEYHASKMLIFADAGDKERCITTEQIKLICSENDINSQVIIISNRHFNNAFPSSIRISKIETLEQSIYMAQSSDIIICPDSFPAHLSGVLGLKTYVIYNTPKLPLYCEYWGSPFDNVIHFEKGKAYKLSGDFTAVPIDGDNRLFELTLKASNL